MAISPRHCAVDPQMGLSPLSLYTLVFLSAVAHASWNALVKNAGDRLLMMGAIRAVGLTYGLVMLPFVPWPSAVTVGWLTCATVAVFAYYGLLIQSYRIGDMSLVYPIARGSAPILLALIAFLTIDERLSSLQIAAVTLTSAGILMLVVGKGGDRIAIALAIATGISIAAYSFFGALGVRASADVLGFQAWLEILTGIGMVSFIAIRRGSAIGAFIRVHYPMGLLAGVLSVAGYLAYLAAAQILPLGPVSALRESSVIFGTVIGAIALREGFAARRIAAAIMVTSGVVALALAGSR
jgi:drug/metabolite transporter (DMT)-like permease